MQTLFAYALVTALIAAGFTRFACRRFQPRDAAVVAAVCVSALATAALLAGVFDESLDALGFALLWPTLMVGTAVGALGGAFLITLRKSRHAAGSRAAEERDGGS